MRETIDRAPDVFTVKSMDWLGDKMYEEMKKLFEQAEPELREVAKKHGFSLRLIDDIKGTLYFYPEVDKDWSPND